MDIRSKKNKEKLHGIIMIIIIIIITLSYESRAIVYINDELEKNKTFGEISISWMTMRYYMNSLYVTLMGRK